MQVGLHYTSKELIYIIYIYVPEIRKALLRRTVIHKRISPLYMRPFIRRPYNGFNIRNTQRGTREALALPSLGDADLGGAPGRLQPAQAGGGANGKGIDL